MDIISVIAQSTKLTSHPNLKDLGTYITAVSQVEATKKVLEEVSKSLEQNQNIIELYEKLPSNWPDRDKLIEKFSKSGTDLLKRKYQLLYQVNRLEFDLLTFEYKALFSN